MRRAFVIYRPGTSFSFSFPTSRIPPKPLHLIMAPQYVCFVFVVLLYNNCYSHSSVTNQMFPAKNGSYAGLNALMNSINEVSVSKVAAEKPDYTQINNHLFYLLCCCSILFVLLLLVMIVYFIVSRCCKGRNWSDAGVGKKGNDLNIEIKRPDAIWPEETTHGVGFGIAKEVSALADDDTEGLFGLETKTSSDHLEGEDPAPPNHRSKQQYEV